MGVRQRELLGTLLRNFSEGAIVLLGRLRGQLSWVDEKALSVSDAT